MAMRKKFLRFWIALLAALIIMPGIPTAASVSADLWENAAVRIFSRKCVLYIEEFKPYPDQWLFLSRLKKVQSNEIEAIVQTVTLDNIDQPDVQQARNSALMRIAEDLGIVENRGGGVGAIIAAMRKYNLSPPLFKSSLSRFNLTFKNHHLLGPDALKWLESTNIGHLNSNQRLALVYTRNEGRITNREYQRLCGVDTIIATRVLGEMVHAGVLNMTGTRRWAFYELSQKLSGLAEDIKFKNLPADSKKIWKYILDNQPVARKDLIKGFRAEFTPNQIDYRLEKMLEAKLIIPTNTREKASNRKYIVV